MTARVRRIAWAATAACLLEASAEKPGNVTPTRDFADTTYTDFILSGLAVGGVLGRAGRLGVGELVRRSVAATRAVVNANTNLGIVLLLAPLARAYALARPADPPGLRRATREVLQGLTVADARAAYAAIRLARPGGLGRAGQHDVQEEPAVSLLEAMTAAAHRDAIAAQYASDYELVFEVGLPALMAALSAGTDPRVAVVQSFLTLLATAPDTLIARKLGLAEAQAASALARAVLAAGGALTPAGRRAQADLDAHLRDPLNRRNPGATADLTAAALFAALLVHGPAVVRRNMDRARGLAANLAGKRRAARC